MLSLKFLDSYFKKIDKVEQGQLKKTFGELKQDYSTLYSTLENMNICIFLLDKEGVPFFINEYAREVFYLKNQIHTTSITNIIPIEEFALQFKRWIKESELNIKAEMMSGKSVKKIWSVEFTNLSLEQAYLKKQHYLAYILVIRDITTEKKLQERILLKKNLDSMQHLAASLAHEIKNPLTSINLYLNLVQRYTQTLEVPEKEEIFSSLNIIQQEVERLSTITTDFLTNIRPLSLSITKIDPEELVLSLRELVQPTLTQEQIHLSISIEENLPLMAGDITYVRMVLLNLLKNSIEAFENKIPSSPDQKQILIKIEENSPFIQITVQDNGCGVTKENLDKVFEPYFTTKKTGSGIGLSLAHKIVLEHKGDIYIESQLGKGTVVRILLPIYQGLVHKFLS